MGNPSFLSSVSWDQGGPSWFLASPTDPAPDLRRPQPTLLRMLEALGGQETEAPRCANSEPEGPPRELWPPPIPKPWELWVGRRRGVGEREAGRRRSRTWKNDGVGCICQSLRRSRFRGRWRWAAVLPVAALPHRPEEEEEEKEAAEDLRRDTTERIRMGIWKERSDLPSWVLQKIQHWAWLKLGRRWVGSHL